MSRTQFGRVRCRLRSAPAGTGSARHGIARSGIAWPGITRQRKLRIGAYAGLACALPYTAAFAEAPEIDHAPATLLVAGTIGGPAALTASAVPTLDNRAVSAGDDILPETDTATTAAFASGMASFYGAELAGNRTASGERFDPADYTAAHRTLPLGSRVRVSFGGRSVVVRINDRGPFHGNRIIDLSKAAAARIGLTRAGRGRVDLAYAD